MIEIEVPRDSHELLELELLELFAQIDNESVHIQFVGGPFDGICTDITNAVPDLFLVAEGHDPLGGFIYRLSEYKCPYVTHEWSRYIKGEMKDDHLLYNSAPH